MRELRGQRCDTVIALEPLGQVKSAFQGSGQGLKEQIFGRLQDQWVPA